VASPASDLVAKFIERYPSSGTPAIYRAPGRVNLIGEHTDYNFGFVMPIAMDLACYAAVAPNGADGNLRLYAEDLLQGYEWPARDIAEAHPQKTWSDYPLGVAQQLARLGREIRPSDLLFHSSAALEVATALALAGDAPLDPLELAKLCHRAENEFVGLPCGIMDQFISIFGKANRAIKLDCRSLEFEEVPLPEDLAIVAVNTMVKHELGASAYRRRVAECSEAVQSIKRRHPEVSSLRDATEGMLEEVSGVAHKRARHVVAENQRVIEFAEAARAGNRRRMGELFVASHRSLQQDYEVSCPELDFLVDTSLNIEGVYGARMTGGGFGGCTVNLVEPGAVGEFRAKIAAAYLAQFAVEPQLYECRPSIGAARIFL